MPKVFINLFFSNFNYIPHCRSRISSSIVSDCNFLSHAFTCQVSFTFKGFAQTAENCASGGGKGSHLITTVNCHSSFRFPQQHTLSRGPLRPFGFASLRQPDACGAGASVGYAAEYLTCGSFAPRIAPASRLGQRPWGIYDSHGLFLAHVYAHIIPLSHSTRSTCSTRLSSSLFVYFVIQISAPFAKT